MRILFDGFWWADGPPSGRNVVRSIIEAWRVAWPGDEVAVTVPANTSQEDRPQGVRTVTVRLNPHGLSNAVELGRASRNYDAVLCHNYAPMVSSNVIVGVFIHDVIYRRSPEWFTRSERLYLAPILPLARRADMIFTSSRTEASHIRADKLLRGSAVPVQAVGLGGANELLSNSPSRIRRPTRYLLAVGRLNARKNLDFLIVSAHDGGHISADRPLVIVGAPDGLQSRTPIVDELVDSGCVIFTGYVSSGELRAWYEGADVFIFPSLDEGFGMPLLEASALGVPVACSDLPVFREVLGANATYFDPYSPRSLNDALLAAQYRSSDSDIATDYFTWEKVAERMRSSLERKMSER